MSNGQIKASAQGYFLQYGEDGLNDYLEKEIKKEKITSHDAESIYKEFTGTDKLFGESEKGTAKNVSGVKAAKPKSVEVIKPSQPAITFTEEKEVKKENYSEGYRRRETNSHAKPKKTEVKPSWEMSYSDAFSDTVKPVQNVNKSKTATYIQPVEKVKEKSYADYGNEAARMEAEFLTGKRSDIDYDEIIRLKSMSRANAPDEVIAHYRDKAYERAKDAEQKANAQKNTVSYSPQKEGMWINEQSKAAERKAKREIYNRRKDKYIDEADMYQGKLEERGVSDKYIRDATLEDITINSFKRGYNTRNLGRESYKDMAGRNNNYAYYEKLLNGQDYQFNPENRLEKTVSNISEFLGGQVHQWTDPEAVGAGLGAAGAALLAGQIGPQVALPEEIITAPGAYIAANTAFQAKAAFEVEAGLAYREMIENGISPETAKYIALGVGGVNGALETLQINDLLKSLKILEVSDATKPFAKKLFDKIIKRFGNAALETGTEVMQEGVTIGGVNLGGTIDNGEAVYGRKEIGNRLRETAESSFGGYTMLGSAGDGIANIYNRKMTVGDYYGSILKNPYDAKVLSKIRSMSEIERIFAQAGANAEDISVAVNRAKGLKYDGKKEWDAYEYGLEQRKAGNGENLDLLIDATDYLDRTGDSGIINTGYGSGELAKPYSSDLIPSEINNYIEQLSDYGSCTEVDKALNFSDISLMSRQTGTEFASVTIGDKHYLIKGDEKGTPISAEMLEEMRANEGKLNCHSHPYIGDLKVSETDLELAKEMYWQDKFYVISPDGQCAVYNKYGIIEVKAVSRQIESEDLAFYEELFEE